MTQAKTQGADWSKYLLKLEADIEKLGMPDRKIDEAIATWNGMTGIGTPPYTASIDAALALVKVRMPGFGRVVDATLPKTGITVTLFLEGHTDEWSGDHPLEACATLLALLAYELQSWNVEKS